MIITTVTAVAITITIAIVNGIIIITTIFMITIAPECTQVATRWARPPSPDRAQGQVVSGPSSTFYRDHTRHPPPPEVRFDRCVTFKLR